MSSTEKGQESPCANVIEWRIDQPDCSEREARKLRSIREEGITDPVQAELLDRACEASGIRQECDHAEDC